MYLDGQSDTTPMIALVPFGMNFLVHPNYWICCKHWSWVIFFFFPHLPHLLVFSSNAKDDNEQGGSRLIVISWFFSQVQKMTTNLLTHRCLLVFFLNCKRWWRARRLLARHNLIVFFLGAENNDKARDLLLFLNFFFKCKRQPQVGIWACRRFLFFFYFLYTKAPPVMPKI
jgi:hypothetical protein